MRAAVLIGFALLVASCGPSQGGGHVKTPDEIIDEQLALEMEDERRAAARKQTYSAAQIADDDEGKKYDTTHAQRELKRAERNAKQCPNVVTEEVTAKKAVVRLTFQNDGKVDRKLTQLSGVEVESSVGVCVLNAMQAVVVPKFTGDPIVVDWAIVFSTEEDSEETIE